jgi:hypothetical protein
MRSTAAILVLALLAGCTTVSPIDVAIADFRSAAVNVQLGDTKDSVLAILEPTQAGLPVAQRKYPETYMKDKVRVEIVYFRSGHQVDGITTDDEFVPYVFHDGKLAAIGWTTLGGPKTQAQPVPQTDVDVYYPYGYPYPYRYPYIFPPHPR